MSILADSTVISNFSQAGSLDILRAVFPKVYVTYEIQGEALRGIEEGYLFLEETLNQIGIGSRFWLELVRV